MSNIQIKGPEDAVKVLGDYICSFDREVLCVINLRADGRPVNCNFVSMGAVNESIAHPREIFKSAILANATSMLILHNHPSGNLDPSKQDTLITDRMLKLCEILGIPLVDHVIVGGKNESYFSFKEKDKLTYSSIQLESDYNNLFFPVAKVAEEEPQVHRRRGR